MVHSFFIKVAACPPLVDYILSKKKSENWNNPPQFSEVYSTFFPKNGYRDEDNISSWLEAIRTDFKFENYRVIVNEYTIAKVEELFHELKLQPHVEDNTHVFQWWLAMAHVYWKLIKAKYDRRDNIFQFMTGFPIYNTRVVILGNRPTGEKPSTGFAFHGVNCDSTKQMLKFAKSELEMVRSIMGEDLFCRNDYDRKWEDAIEKCSLKGWIEQGVLLLNTYLTHHERSSICFVWNMLTDFFVKYLSKRATNLVFILLGHHAKRKQHIINELKHKVIPLYHPAYYSFSDEIKQDWKYELDWETAMPLISTNLYLYHTAGRTPVNWANVKGQRQDQDEGTFLRHI